MTSRIKVALLSLALAAIAFTLAPLASADAWDKETIVTFTNAVEVPGQVLAPGTYVFKLAGNQSDRRIVQIFTQGQRKLVATIMALQDYRVEPTGETVISFDERPSGRPEAVRSWFYPGDSNGVEFVYPSRMTQLTSSPAAASPSSSATPAKTPDSSDTVLVVQPQ